MPEFYYEELCDELIGIFFDVYNENDFGFREKYYEERDYFSAFEYAKKAREEAAFLSYIPPISNNIILICALILGVSVLGFTLGYWVHNRTVHRKSMYSY